MCAFFSFTLEEVMAAVIGPELRRRRSKLETFNAVNGDLYTDFLCALQRPPLSCYIPGARQRGRAAAVTGLGLHRCCAGTSQA